MPFLTIRNLQKLREKFSIPNQDALRWFPGHMGKGIKKMQQKLKIVDCVIEVHDSRIPLSGRNPLFKRTVIGPKPHILVLNKADLVGKKYSNEIIRYIQETENISHIIYTECRDQVSEGLPTLVPVVQDLIKSSTRHNRIEDLNYNVLIIGVPNVGKSSLINALRKKYLNQGKAAAVGAVAGITRAVQEKIKISNVPKVFVLDTPGILTPSVPNVEVGMKLALCSTLQDHLVGNIVMADYLLYWMNKQGCHNYFDFFGVNEPCDNIGLLLTNKAVKNNSFLRVKDVETGKLVKKPNLQAVAALFIHSFRTGLFGPIILDADILPFKVL